MISGYTFIHYSSSNSMTMYVIPENLLLNYCIKLALTWIKLVSWCGWWYHTDGWRIYVVLWCVSDSDSYSNFGFYRQSSVCWNWNWIHLVFHNKCTCRSSVRNPLSPFCVCVIWRCWWPIALCFVPNNHGFFLHLGVYFLVFEILGRPNNLNHSILPTHSVTIVG